MNEKAWTVSLRDGVLMVATPARKRAKMRMSDAIGIAIESNPASPDKTSCTWHVTDGKTTLRFPFGASGESQFLSVLQTLPGFQQQAIHEALASLRTDMFVVYKKTK